MSGPAPRRRLRGRRRAAPSPWRAGGAGWGRVRRAPRPAIKAAAAAPQRCAPAGTMRAACWLGLGLLLWLCRPAEPWYRPAAGPRHYSVGRASGLLTGLRRPPHARRSDTDSTVLLPGLPAWLRTAVSTGAVLGAQWALGLLPMRRWARSVPGWEQGPVPTGHRDLAGTPCLSPPPARASAVCPGDPPPC